MKSKSSTLKRKRLRPVAAGIVEQDVKRRLRAHGASHRVEIRHVERQRLRRSALGADGGRGLFDLAPRARGQHHMRARIRQRRGGGKPDAAAGASHQRALAVQTEARAEVGQM